MDLYIQAFLKLIRSRDSVLFRYVYSVIWQLRHNRAQGYYLQFFCIYVGAAETKILTDHAQLTTDQWSETTNGYVRAHMDANAHNTISVNCQDENQINRVLLRVKDMIERGTQHHYLRVMRNRRKTFVCERIGIKLL